MRKIPIWETRTLSERRWSAEISTLLTLIDAGRHKQHPCDSHFRAFRRAKGYSLRVLFFRLPPGLYGDKRMEEASRRFMNREASSPSAFIC